MIDLRQRFEQGGTALGCFSLMVEPMYVEILGSAGFDFVILDCEEANGDSYGGRLDELVRASEAAGLVPTTRVVENTPGAINRALNAGSRLLFVPHIRTAEAAADAAASFRYPPLGQRGAAPVVRAAHFGLEQWSEYHRRSNENNLLFVMLEDLESVHNVEDIVRVPGVDGVLVGTWDLAVEMGCADYGPPAPEVMKHVEHVIRVTREAGLYVSAHGWSADAATKYVELGAQLLIVSLDSTILMNGLRSLAGAAGTARAAAARGVEPRTESLGR